MIPDEINWEKLTKIHVLKEGENTYVEEGEYVNRPKYKELCLEKKGDVFVGVENDFNYYDGVEYDIDDWTDDDIRTFLLNKDGCDRIMIGVEYE